MSSYEIATGFISFILWGLKITWANGIVDELIQYKQDGVVGGAGMQGATGVLATAQYSGILSMFDTECNMFLQLFPVGDATSRGPAVTGADGGTLYFWRGVTSECVVGPASAPDMGVFDESGLRQGRAPGHSRRGIEHEGSVSEKRLLLTDRSGELDVGGYTPNQIMDAYLFYPGGCSNRSACWNGIIKPQMVDRFVALNITNYNKKDWVYV